MRAEGVYNSTLPTFSEGAAAPLQTDANGRVLTTSGAGTAGTTAGGVQTVQSPADGVALTKASVTMTGSSAALVGADATRLVVMVSNAAANAEAAIDITGGTCALDAGIPLTGGATLEIRGKAAQSAMTQIGTNTQKLTVYTG